MEPESKRDKIEILLEEILQLIAGHRNMDYWADGIKKLRDNYVHLTHSKTKKEAAKIILLALYGGMGSFLDTFLHRGNDPLIEENDKLIALRHELYIECDLLQYTKLSSRLTDTFINAQYKSHELNQEDVLCQYVSEKGVIGRFFCREAPDKLIIEKTIPPIRPEPENFEQPRFCQVKIPQGTIMRLGKIASQRANRPEGVLDIYIDQPWRIHGLEIIKKI